MPTPIPTAFPTRRCGGLSPQLRQDFIGLVANVVSGGVAFQAGSPQNDAFNWIVNVDPDYLCPEDSGLVTRYTLAAFYFSTRGGRWTRCRAPPEFEVETEEAANQACPQGNAWLTSGSECDWSFITCDENDEVVEISIGKLSLGRIFYRLRLQLLSSPNCVVTMCIPVFLSS